MSSQPYVYKPPVRRTAPNPSSKSQILPETANTFKTEGFKVNKISDLGPSQLFQGLDNLQSKVTKNRIPTEQKITPKKDETKQQIKDQSISGQNRFERKQVNKLGDQKSTLTQQSSSRVKQSAKVSEQQVEKQLGTLINAPLGRKPAIERSVKQQLKDQSKEKPVLVSRKPQIQTQKISVQEEKGEKSQTNSFVYKPLIKRSQRPSFNPTTIARNRSQLLTKQTQKIEPKQQSINNLTSNSSIYQRKEQKRSSIVNMNLQVNTEMKIFDVQTKKDLKQVSVEKISTQKSIESSIKITPNGQIKKTQEIAEKTPQILPQKNIYSYQRPKTKAELVRENQLKASQKQKQENQSASSSKIEQSKPIYAYKSKSTIFPKAQVEQKLPENNSTIIGEKQLKPQLRNLGKKTKQQSVDQNNQNLSQLKIVVSGEKKETEKSASSSYVYQPAFKRTQKPVQEINTLSQQEEVKQQEGSGKKSELLIQNKRAQYPAYQRKDIISGKSQSQLADVVTTKPLPVAFTKQPQPKEQPQSQLESIKEPIPPIAFSLLNILIKKKLSTNLKYSFSQIQNSIQLSIKREKCLQSFLKKSVALSSTYINNLQQECFNSLKKNFISFLVSSQSTSTQNKTAQKILPKTQTLKQNEQINNLVETMKKPLCYQLSQLLNSKLRSVLKEKLYNIYNQKSYSAKKSPIFLTLFKLFNTKASNNIKNSFLKLKFSYSHVQKSNDEDVLTLFETKNKKLSKQQIVKYFQNIFQTQAVSTSNSRVSLLQKTPQKGKNKIENRKGINELISSKADSQKVSQIKSKIQFLEKQLKDQQKLKKDKQSEISSKKMELKRQIEEMKKENKARKRENEELKEKLKKFEVISFSDRKEDNVLYQFATSNKMAQSLQKEKSKNNEILGMLCKLYVSNIIGNEDNSSKEGSLSLESFLKRCEEENPLVIKSMNYVMGNQDSQGGNLMEDSNEYVSMLKRSKLVIQQQMLIEQNRVLKWEIEYIESKMIGGSDNKSQIGQSKANDELQAMRCLCRNYIKQRYLWEWIRRSIQDL